MSKRRRDSNPFFFGRSDRERKIHDPDTEISVDPDATGEKDILLAKQIRSLPRMKCPQGVTEEILRITVKQKNPGSRLLLQGWFPNWQFRIAVVSAAMVILSVVIFHPSKQTALIPVSQQMSEAEAERAREQLKWSLVYTSQLLNKTEKEAIGEAVINELPKTLRNTLKKTIPLFKGGES